MSGKNYFEGGQWNAVCFRCGFKFKSSELRRTWQGFWACDTCWEPRHPQDFVRGIPDNSGVPWAQNENWVLASGAPQCTIPGMSAIPGYAVPGCSIPDNRNTGMQ